MQAPSHSNSFILRIICIGRPCHTVILLRLLDEGTQDEPFEHSTVKDKHPHNAQGTNIALQSLYISLLEITWYSMYDVYWFMSLLYHYAKG